MYDKKKAKASYILEQREYMKREFAFQHYFFTGISAFKYLMPVNLFTKKQIHILINLLQFSIFLD
jgi:hypothetical protein